MRDDVKRELLDRARELRARARELAARAVRARNRTGPAEGLAHEQPAQTLPGERSPGPAVLSSETEAILRRQLTRQPEVRSEPDSPPLPPTPTEPGPPMAELVGTRPGRAGPA